MYAYKYVRKYSSMLWPYEGMGALSNFNVLMFCCTMSLRDKRQRERAMSGLPTRMILI